ncbi:unnamed protein product [Cyclocybe aegerita]|uniref:G domain-containing protein n=1 Tax=Cyclocybe aegerita TaxID=1973307 RepID=A0A8S0WVI1_CYCAE|nr:unnamed protein product [Cyclocybe aegerita]
MTTAIRNSPPRSAGPIILTIGTTGVGRSNFISLAAGDRRDRVGYGLSSFTDRVEEVEVIDPQLEWSCILVDTPSFDHTYQSDIEILGSISEWLLSIILTALEKICGPANFKKIGFVTMWGKYGRSYHESQCKEAWGDILNRGARIFRFENTSNSARNIISTWCQLLQQQSRSGPPLQLVRELTDSGGLRSLGQTSAAKALGGGLSKSSTGLPLKALRKAFFGLQESRQRGPDNDSLLDAGYIANEDDGGTIHTVNDSFDAHSEISRMTSGERQPQVLTFEATAQHMNDEDIISVVNSFRSSLEDLESTRPEDIRSAVRALSGRCSDIEWRVEDLSETFVNHVDPPAPRTTHTTERNLTQAFTPLRTESSDTDSNSVHSGHAASITISLGLEVPTSDRSTIRSSLYDDISLLSLESNILRSHVQDSAVESNGMESQDDESSTNSVAGERPRSHSYEYLHIENLRLQGRMENLRWEVTVLADLVAEHITQHATPANIQNMNPSPGR